MLRGSETSVKKEQEYREVVASPRANMAQEQTESIVDNDQRDLYSMYMKHMQPIAEEEAKHFKQQMQDQDEYLSMIKHPSDSSTNLALRKNPNEIEPSNSLIVGGSSPRLDHAAEI